MLLLGLMLIAAVSIIFGLTLESVAWLVVALIATVLAALVLFRSWRTIREQRTQMARGSRSEKAGGRGWLRGRKAAGPEESTGGGAPALDADAEVLVVDGRPDYHRSGCSRLSGLPSEPIPYSQAVEDGFTPCPVCAPLGAAGGPAVWVVDGSPEYHSTDCTTLAGRDAEPIPLEQAVEDGFAPCFRCSPPPPPGGAASVAQRVWVADGHPEYHHQGCAELDGLSAEPIPYDQAVEDGFQPCVVCNPDVEFAAGAPATAPLADTAGTAEEPEAPLPVEPAAVASEPEPAPAEILPTTDEAEVWVADGYPDYHAAGCHELNGLESEAVPFSQAVEDGFTPCAVCRPDRDEAAEQPSEPAPMTAAAAQVWVVDGFPNYHRAGCVELAGLDGEPIEHEQAIEDGFEPCPVCAPDAAEAPAAPEEPQPEAVPGLAEPTPEAELAEPVVPAAAESAAALADVWVADGYPDYHRAGCVELIGLDTERIPHDQAVEDGFAACVVCDPEAAEAPLVPEPAAEETTVLPDLAAVPEPAAVTSEFNASDDVLVDVWVVDGYPDYHRSDCVELIGLDSEPIPHDQAVEDGFSPCPLCAPDGTVVAEQPSIPEPVAEVAPEPEPEPIAVVAHAEEVWVVDGHPDFHLSGCRELAGLAAELISFDQAVEDDFQPCEVCKPHQLGAVAPSDYMTIAEEHVAEPATAPPVLPELEPEPEPEPRAAAD